MKIIRQTGSEENKIGNCRSNGKGRGGANKARQAKGGQDKLKGPCANCPHTGKLLHLVEAMMVIIEDVTEQKCQPPRVGFATGNLQTHSHVCSAYLLFTPPTFSLHLFF